MREQAGRQRRRALGTQAEAVQAGRAQAITDQAEHIHGEDGAIRERNSYGNDPTSSKG